MKYNYECESCSAQFEDDFKIVERDIPCLAPCPECGKNTIKRVLVGAPCLGSDIVRIPSGFKQVLRNIKKKNHGSVIPDY